MKKTTSSFVFLFIVVVFFVSLSKQQTGPAIVETISTGKISGYTLNGINYFLGIPFAQPPVGPLRFAAPQPLKPWSNTISVTQYAPICPQRTFNQGSQNFPNYTMSEDCLYINVIAPNNANAQNLPVMVWIYGNSFDTGDGSTGYNGASFVDAEGHWPEMVFVSFNYRIGPLGFLAHPALQKFNGGSTGFYGIQDQVMALQWVQQNIAVFGGDPQQVTLVGDSAGAVSVCIHSVLPASSGLFSQIIAQSGFCEIWPLGIGLDEGIQLADSVGCPQSLSPSALLSCLQSINVTTLLSPSSHHHSWSRFFPVVDGVYLTAQPTQLLSLGAINNISAAIVGSNENEGGFFGCRRYAGATPSTFTSVLDAFFGNSLASQVEAQYPLSLYSSPTAALNAIFSDFPYRCGTKYLADQLLQNGVPTWMYSFNDLTGLASNPCYGASHGFELPYLFPNLVPYYVSQYGGQPFNAQQAALSEFMLQSWATFIATGTPNERGAPEWPAYNSNAPYVILDIYLNPAERGTNFGNGNCNFWQAHPCQPDLPSNTCQFNQTSSGDGGDGGGGDGLSGGAIAGIVIGSTIGAFILLLSLIVIVVLIVMQRRRFQSRPPAYKLMKEEDS